MKGYKAASGNYITVADIKVMNKRFKLIQNESKLKQDQQQQFKEALYIVMHKAEIQEQKKQELLKQEITDIKNNIMLELRKNNSFTYKQYLIIWDIMTSNYIQIMSDLNKRKINKSDITIVLQYIECYSKRIINEYWKDILLR